MIENTGQVVEIKSLNYPVNALVWLPVTKGVCDSEATVREVREQMGRSLLKGDCLLKMDRANE